MFKIFKKKEDIISNELKSELKELRHKLIGANKDKDMLLALIKSYRRDYVLPLAKSINNFSKHKVILNDLNIFRIGDAELLKRMGK